MIDKQVIMKYKNGGCKIVSNIIMALVDGNTYYIMTADTDSGVCTTKKIVDGFFEGERFSQYPSSEIIPW